MHRPHAAGVVVLAVCLMGTQLQAQSAPTQLQETHGDWRVLCVQESDRRLCSLSQQQVQKETGQLVVRVELMAVGDSLDGTMVLPFGVAVDQPVTLLLDDVEVIKRSYRTCLPVGCVAALSLDATRVAQFRRAAVLTVKTAIVSPRQNVSFKIPLTGFASALARAATFAK